jgi:hypothetical protein
MKLLLIVSLIFAGCVPITRAQSVKPAAWEIGAGYNYVHTNAPPAECGCFPMNGGTASIARHVSPAFSLAFEMNGVNNGNVNATRQDLRLFSYLAGPRYSYVPAHGRFVPYGQILAGAAFASGRLYGSSPSLSGSTNAFAAGVGGGVDVILKPHLALRILQAEYLLSLLSNGVNDRQNNLSLSTGIVFRVGHGD